MRLDAAVALVTGSRQGVSWAIELRWAGYGNIAKAGRQLAQALVLIGIEFENGIALRG